MPWPVHPNGLLGAQGDNDNYQISRSLRFNSGDLAYLTRTPGSAGDRKKFTISMWIKRGKLGIDSNPIFAWPGGNTLSFQILFNTSNQLEVIANIEGIANQYRLQTTQVFRDPSAWYHLVLASDTSQLTDSNRLSVYINGSKITSFGIATYPSIDFENSWNNTVANYIGFNNYFDGYLAEIYNIDGQALTPSSFGETDAITGRWKAKAYSGTYGTNGFYLKFADNSSTAALGTDSSGNGNTWATNNFSVTAGEGNDSLVDSPTNYGSDTGAGGTLRGNYCTLNPLDKGSSATLSDGNLVLSLSAASSVRGTIGVSSGKWYWETIWGGTSGLIGIAKGDTLLSSYVGRYSDQWAYAQTGEKYTGNVGVAYGATFTTGDIIGVALNVDSGQLTFYKNGASQGVAYSGLTSGPYFPAFGDNSATTNHVTNFGQRPFAYTAPTGFKALCTTNLTTPTIKKPSSYFDAVAYTGTGASNSISSLGFSPDLVWIKNRGGATSHALYDAVRGVQAQLSSDTFGSEVTSSTGLTAFGSNGFTIGTSTLVNTSGTQYVSWAWDAGESSVTNNSGSITSTVRANAQDGVSVVSYTGTGANATVGHGLGVAPKMMIVKSRSSGGSAAYSWVVWHSSLTGSEYLILNLTQAKASAATIWNSTVPTSSVLNLGTDSAVNENSVTYIAYLFAEIEGFSKFGSYTGNGSADGPFVYCGFRPRWVMIKQSSTSGNNWQIIDAARSDFNFADKVLFPNTAGAETTANATIDIVSSGFKIRTADGTVNTSSATYIFAAFAEAPFKYARAR